HSGSLGLQFSWISSADGRRIRLFSTNKHAEGDGKKGAASTASVAGMLLLAPIALLGHNFVHGRDVVRDANRAQNAFVDDTVHVTAKQPQSTDRNAGFAH
ncbi:MAG: hypothetical protein ABR591_15875, partial [Candidatus Velthaea sp.]